MLERSQRVAAPIDRVWGFFSNPANLARITPPSLRFEVHGPPPTRLERGTRIEYRIRWLFLRLAWLTRITRWNPPIEFEDVQERGPYRRWIHMHRFEPDGDRVVMHDRVEYELPLGPIGRFVHRLLVRRQLETIFDYRRRAIEEIFPGR